MVALCSCVISHPLLFKVSSSSRTFSQIYFGYRGDFLRCAVHWDMEMSLLMKLETETVDRSQAHTEDPAQAFADADGVHSDRGAGTVADTAPYERTQAWSLLAQLHRGVQVPRMWVQNMACRSHPDS